MQIGLRCSVDEQGILLTLSISVVTSLSKKCLYSMSFRFLDFTRKLNFILFHCNQSIFFESKPGLGNHYTISVGFTMVLLVSFWIRNGICVKNDYIWVSDTHRIRIKLKSWCFKPGVSDIYKINLKLRRFQPFCVVAREWEWGGGRL